MKNIFLIVFLLSALNTYAQDSSVVLSKFEEFTSETGRMFKFEYYELGKINNIEFEIVKATDLSNREAARALLIFQGKISLFTAYHSGILAIDFDEIEGMTKALEYYLNIIENDKPLYEPHYHYLTSNRVQAACTYEVNGIYSGWNISLSRRYKYLICDVPGSKILIRKKDIRAIIEIFKKSKETEY